MKIKEILIVVIVLIIDLLTKTIIQTNINLHREIYIIKDFFYITYTKNIGAGWSILEGQQLLLSLVAVIAIIGMLVWMVKNKNESMYLRLPVSLMIAGALGTLIDRLYFGYVRDFIGFIIFGYHFPIFNVADMALTIGVGILFVVTLFEKEVNDGKS